MKMLKVRVAEIVMVPRERLKFMDGESPEKEVNEDMEVATEVFLKDARVEGKPEYHYIDVSLDTSGSTFVYRIDKRSSHEDVLCGLAAILGYTPRLLSLYDIRGLPWFYPESSSMVVATICSRGGVRTQASISATVPYQPDDPAVEGNELLLDPAPLLPEDPAPPPSPHLDVQEDQEVPLMSEDPPQPDVPMQDQPQEHPWHNQQIGYIPEIEGDTGEEDDADEEDAYHYRWSEIPPGRLYQRERSRSRSRATNGSRDSRVVWASAFPRTPPPGQPERVPRQAHDRRGYVGVVRAAPEAPVEQVLSELQLPWQPYSPLWVVQAAVTWQDVLVVRLPNCPLADCVFSYDLRTTRWERYQRIRRVMVLQNGEQEHTVLLPWELSLWEAQERIDRIMPTREVWSVVAVTPRDWVIVVHELPDRLLDGLDDLEAYRRGEMPYRGGAKGDMAIFNVIFARTTRILIEETYAVDEGHHVIDVLKHLSKTYRVHEQMLLLKDGSYVPQVHDEASVLRGRTMELHGVKYVGQPEREWEHMDHLTIQARRFQWYAEQYSAHEKDMVLMIGNFIPWIGDKVAMLEGKIVTIFIMEVPSYCVLNSLRSQEYLEKARVWQRQLTCPPREPRQPADIIQPFMVRRGGGRESHKGTQDPKSAMRACAMDKVEREYPGIMKQTISTTQKAEARTVGAILNAKSPSQTQQVAIAATKRAGLSKYLHELVPGYTRPSGLEEQAPEVKMEIEKIAAFQGQHTQKLTDMVTSLTNQAEMTGVISNQLQQKATSQELHDVMSVLQQHTVAQLEAFSVVAQGVSVLEVKVDTIIRTLAERPCDIPDTQTVVGDTDYHSDQGDEPAEQQSPNVDRDAPTPRLDEERVAAGSQQQTQPIEIDDDNDTQENMELEFESAPVNTTELRHVPQSRVMGRIAEASRTSRQRDAPRGDALNPFRT